MSEYFGLKTAIEEAKDYLAKQIESVETFTTHQSRTLTYLGLIVTISGLLISQGGNLHEVSKVAMTLISILFAFNVGNYLFSIMPITLKFPIKIDFDVFEDIYFNKTEKEILQNKLENYIDVINENREFVNQLLKRSKLTNFANIGILGIFLAIFIDFIW